MLSPILMRELREHLERLSESDQRKVVKYARDLARENQKEFLKLTGVIESDDTELMKQAIEENR